MGYIKIQLEKHGYAECGMCDICPMCDLMRLKGTIKRSTDFSDETKEKYYSMIEERLKQMVEFKGEL